MMPDKQHQHQMKAINNFSSDFLTSMFDNARHDISLAIENAPFNNGIGGVFVTDTIFGLLDIEFTEATGVFVFRINNDGKDFFTTGSHYAAIVFLMAAYDYTSEGDLTEEEKQDVAYLAGMAANYKGQKLVPHHCKQFGMLIDGQVGGNTVKLATSWHNGFHRVNHLAGDALLRKWAEEDSQPHQAG
jgi:hypothetical protein